ncbi:uncharacterized protein TNCV_3407641 [Trichonephila clavipes]|nr:uncharacterized protein TNCV_3407641 [Trichonephila clavipes]
MVDLDTNLPGLAVREDPSSAGDVVLFLRARNDKYRSTALVVSRDHSWLNLLDAEPVLPHSKIEEYNFEVVDSFTYLGSEINNRNDCLTEIHKRVTTSNRGLNGIRKYRKSNLIEGKTKVLLFVEWAQNEIAVVPDFHKRILFSDEAHFWLNSYVNKQNYRIWSEANPQVYVQTPLHPEKLTVWCALWAGGILLQKR